MSRRLCVGVDLGATRLRVGIVSDSGEVLAREEVSTQEVVRSRPDEYVIADKILEIVDKLCRRLSMDKSRLEGIGIGSIGPLDVRRGRVIHSPNIPVPELVLREYLEEKLHIPVYVVNDCVAAVWGEKVLGQCRSYSNILYITFSTGIGGGVIVNDTLLLGADGNAHEIGHVVVDPSDDALECGCGGRGHWEAYCSGVGIPKFLRYLADKWPDARETLLKILSCSSDPRDVTVEFFRRLRQGCPICRRVFAEISKLNAAGIATCIHFYNPEVIVLGGSIVLHNEDLIFEFRQYLPRYVMRGFRIPEFKIATFRDDAVLVGAAAVVFKPPDTLLRMIR